MRRLCGNLCCLCAALAVSGCFSSGRVRTPDLLRGQLPSGHASQQRRNFEIHDPLPSEDLGPNTDTRPREFRIPRAQPRRAKENYYAPSLLPGESPSYSIPTTKYPGTVSPN